MLTFTQKRPYTASYSVRVRSYFPENKAAGEWSLLLTFILCQGKEYVVLYLHSNIRLYIVNNYKFTTDFTILTIADDRKNWKILKIFLRVS